VNIFLKDWIYRPKMTINGQIILNDKSSQAKQPHFMTDIKLLPYQLAVIHALGEFEKTHQAGRYRTDSIRVKLPPGTGKTHAVLGHVLNNPIPPQFGKFEKLFYNQTNYVLAERIGDNREYVPANIIFVATSVFQQWKTVLDSITGLSYFAIDNQVSMNEFANTIPTGMIMRYQIILVKLGDISSGNLQYLESENTAKKFSTVNVFSALTARLTFPRVILDDYDVNADYRTAILPDSSIFLLVSATNNMQPMLKVDNNRRVGATLNALLYDSNTLTANLDWVNACSRITKINAWKYKILNPQQGLIDAVGELDDGVAVADMLNGDAVADAARTAGAEVASITAIIKRLISKNYKKYAKARMLMDIFSQEKVEEWLENGDEIEEQKPMSESAIKKKIADFKREKKVTFPQYVDEGLATAIIGVYDHNRAISEQIAPKVNSVLDNFRAGSCEVCTRSVENLPVMLLICCNKIVCVDCFTVKIGNPTTMSKSTSFQCICCRSRVPFSTVMNIKSAKIEDLCFDGEDEIDLAEDDGDVDASDVDTTDADIPADKKILLTEKPINKKFEIALRVLLGDRNSTEQVQVSTYEHEQPAGAADVGVAPERVPVKCLIFCNYDGPLKDLHDYLSANGIASHMLKGSPKKIAEIVTTFASDTSNALLINSITKCAGLNLQFATDMILMQPLDNKKLETQVVGRAQRIGRVHNLRLHQFEYI
jgi:hypothetical protein